MFVLFLFYFKFYFFRCHVLEVETCMIPQDLQDYCLGEKKTPMYIIYYIYTIVSSSYIRTKLSVKLFFLCKPLQSMLICASLCKMIGYVPSSGVGGAPGVPGFEWLKKGKEKKRETFSTNQYHLICNLETNYLEVGGFLLARFSNDSFIRSNRQYCQEVRK